MCLLSVSFVIEREEEMDRSGPSPGVGIGRAQYVINATKGIVGFEERNSTTTTTTTTSYILNSTSLLY